MELGAVISIIQCLDARGRLVIPIVYSDKKEGQGRPMYWKFPSGHVEESDLPRALGNNETPDAALLVGAAKRAALRETEEETGLCNVVELTLVCTIDKRNHRQYVFSGKATDLSGLYPLGTPGKTGERVTLATPAEIAGMRGEFLPQHLELIHSLQAR